MGSGNMPYLQEWRSEMNRCFNLPKVNRIEFSQEALKQMQTYKQQQAGSCEAGGVLLGRKLLDSGDWVVDAVTTPQATDKRSRFSFFRAKHPHQAAIDKVWAESGGTTGYLGEWHTHPEANPIPSRKDYSEWKKALKRFSYDGDSLFFAIVGTSEIATFVGCKQAVTIIQLLPT
jgi:integrative and conjugative element protein (TIGR02256 family)